MRLKNDSKAIDRLPIFFLLKQQSLKFKIQRRGFSYEPFAVSHFVWQTNRLCIVHKQIKRDPN